MKRFHITGRHTVIALALGGCATDPPEKLAATDQDTDLSAAESRACAECGALSRIILTVHRLSFGRRHKAVLRNFRHGSDFDQQIRTV